MRDFQNKENRSIDATPLMKGFLGLSMHPNGDILYVTTAGQVEACNAYTGKKSYTLGAPGEINGWHVALSQDGRWLATEVGPTNVAVWDTSNRTRLFSLPPESSKLSALAWSPDRQRLAVGLKDGAVIVWDLNKVASLVAELGLSWPDDGGGQPAAGTVAQAPVQTSM